jgi:hypothetical protein
MFSGETQKTRLSRPEKVFFSGEGSTPSAQVFTRFARYTTNQR